MPKEIINYMKTKFFIFAIFSLLFSCTNQNDGYKHITLLLEPQNSQYTDNRFLMDSINVENGDSFKITRYNGDYQFKSIYHRKENGLYEIRKRCNEELECFGTDTILTFYKSDTSFIYNSAYIFIPIVFLYTFADCKYDIIKEKDVYKTVKQSLVDTTYKEIYYYDQDFNIYKYINTWKDNRCVYLRNDYE
jgi:hypothetical protein